MGTLSGRCIGELAKGPVDQDLFESGVWSRLGFRVSVFAFFI